MARIMPGARGIGTVLIHEGCKYHCSKTSATSTTWQVWRMPCRAILCTNVFDKDASDPDIAVVSSEDHSHETDDQVIADSMFLNEAKRALVTVPTKPIKRLDVELIATGHRNAAGQGD